MRKDTELSLACYRLVKAIQNGNKILTDEDYEKRWESFKFQSQKLKNLRKRA